MNQQTNVKPKFYGKGYVIGLILLILFIVIVVAIYNQIRAYEVDRVNEGCEAVAFNQLGFVTLWNCPVYTDEGEE